MTSSPQVSADAATGAPPRPHAPWGIEQLGVEGERAKIETDARHPWPPLLHAATATAAGGALCSPAPLHGKARA
jgi:hypothetical protein